MKVIVPLAPGFEEIEAITIIDVLRRANVEVHSAGVEDVMVVGSHMIPVKADYLLNTCNPDDYNCIVLPGGMPGSENLKKNSEVHRFINRIYSNNGYVAAICAAPIVLGALGLLRGKMATCYPGFEKELEGAHVSSDPVVVDGTVITGKGPGCALDFALTLVELLAGKEIKVTLKNAMQVYWMR